MKKIFYILLCNYILCTTTSVMSTNITLISSDEKPSIVSKEITNFSETIKKLLEDVGKSKEPIPIPGISSKILEEIVKNFDDITQHARKHIQGNGYVTQDVQKIVDAALKNKDSECIKEYIDAIDYLDISMLRNASARFIVENNNIIVPEIKFSRDSEILPYIKKHQMLGKTKEMTMADFLAIHSSNNKLKSNPERGFSNVGLTSLFGIEQVERPDTIEWLFIISNSFLDPAHDPDFPKEPFKYMINLKRISLGHNQLPLSFLPETFFKGLKNLTAIELQNNQLTNLPENLFKGLDKLEVIDLSWNKLTALPKNMFKDLRNLKIVNILHNNFSLEAKLNLKSGIKAVSPNAKVTFHMA